MLDISSENLCPKYKTVIFHNHQLHPTEATSSTAEIGKSGLAFDQVYTSYETDNNLRYIVKNTIHNEGMTNKQINNLI